MGTEQKPVAVRLNTELYGLLEKLVDYDRDQLLEMGLGSNTNTSTVIRRLIRQEAKRVGIGETPSPVASKKKPAAKGKR